MNAETDFVSKGDDFKNFLGNSLKLLLEKQIDVDLQKGNSQIESLLKEVRYDSSNTMEESTKLLIAKTKEKIEFSKILAFTGSRL